MINTIKIATWNINGLSPNKSEVETLINFHDLDVLLISETHFTYNSQIKIKNDNIYATNHPDGTAHGGTAVIIRESIKHHELPQFSSEHIQATTIAVHDSNGDIILSSVYCPPKHNLKEEQLTVYVKSLGPRFIAGGDWNAKHVHWGSRLNTTRGRELKKCVDTNKLITIATSEPTHWPTDTNKLPDVLDFFIMKGLGRLFYNIQSCLDGSSNHIPVILTIGATVLNRQKSPRLYNSRTDWTEYRSIIDTSLKLKVALKSIDDIDNAVIDFTRTIQEACWKCTHEFNQDKPRHNTVPLEIRQMILEKRRLRRVWHVSRHTDDKRALNKAIQDLKQAIKDAEDLTLEANLQSLSATSATAYSLWKVCKNTNHPKYPKPPIRIEGRSWARTNLEKANAFAEHLANVFVPNEPEPGIDDVDKDNILKQDFQMEMPIKCTPQEIRRVIKALYDKKAPGFDLIDEKVLEERPAKAIVFLTTIFNSMLRVGYYPLLWKVSQIIMIHKPGKPPHEVASYRPISLLPVLSKLFEKLLLRRLLSSMSIIPDHQFGFRPEHATEQIHRVCRVIRNALETKQYCSSVFLDVQQAFDRVWHKGLLCKIKSHLPHCYYNILESYLSDRIFQVKEDDSTSSFHNILAGVPQGSVLGPVLYTIFTADLPQNPGVTIATYADDTAVLACSNCPNRASENLQESLDEIHNWFAKWRIRANTSKSVQVIFTLRHQQCPPVKLGHNQLPQSECVKYLGMHLDQRLTWRKHIETKRKELDIRYKGMYWLLGRNSKLSVDNKILIYKIILKPIWTYGIQLWGSACNSNINMIQRTQNNILKQISNAPWFIRNTEVHEHLNMKTVKEEISSYSQKYKSRLEKHPNQLAAQLTIPDYVSRLKRRNILQLDNL